MGKLQVLLSVLNMDSINYIDSLKITGDAVVINQYNTYYSEIINRQSINSNYQPVNYFKTKQHRLSKNRN